MMIERYFSTAGPVKEDLHYCVPSLKRFDLDEILNLIRQQKYFILHAPRQVGKTSYMLALMDYLNEQGKYRALYVNIETAQAAREDVYAGIRAILSRIGAMAKYYLDDTYPDEHWRQILERDGEHSALVQLLDGWSQHNPKPLVLFIDEIDALIGDTLISVLRQLRAGYASRPISFPQSIILCGIRDVRDYRIHSSREKTIITGGSAFNVKAESLRLGDFTEDETRLLYQMHTDTSGQSFSEGAVSLLWHLSQGQPWLANALGYEVCFAMKENRDRSVVITAEMVQIAKERLILRRDTHLDQLADKLKEPRVQQIIAPMLAGDDNPEHIDNDHISYVEDLGLIHRDRRGMRIANPIYREIIPRELNFSAQMTITQESTWYIDDEGRLDIPKLLTAFQKFFREHSEHWVERFDYKEAGPQLLMQAFLQRVVNGGGRIEREYGFGRKRTDLCVIWPIRSEAERERGYTVPTSAIQRAVIELKIRYGDLEETIKEGLAQTWEYMDRCNTDEGYLIIFDRSIQKRSWDEKIFVCERQHEGKKITVWGM